jgi:electron transport complex protein RnfD
MGDVHLALVPVVLVSVWCFGFSSLLVILAATAGAVGVEWLWGRPGPNGSPLKDGSAALTGILLGLTLPPGLPLWMAFIGGVAGVGLGKLIWGGLGHNLSNNDVVATGGAVGAPALELCPALDAGTRTASGCDHDRDVPQPDEVRG